MSSYKYKKVSNRGKVTRSSGASSGSGRSRFGIFPDNLSKFSLLPLRAFLGFTFIFASLQKLANPAFFRASFPGSIQAQFKAYSHTSPIGPILHHFLGLSPEFGLFIALGELATGLGILLGFMTRLASLGGMIISFMLFLTVSFHTNPYYTGSDIVFFFAQTPLLIAGGGEVLCLDAYLASYFERRAQTKNDMAHVERLAGIRRVAGVVAVAGAVMAILDAILGRAFNGSRAAVNNSSVNSLGNSGTAASNSNSGTSSEGSGSGSRIGNASSVPVGSVKAFTDPVSGDPSYVYHYSQGEFLAFDGICTHAGCTVMPEVSQGIFLCPCHGSQFSLNTGEVIQGPATTPLKKLNISDSGGELYVTD